jgi:hypothetical protein
MGGEKGQEVRQYVNIESSNDFSTSSTSLKNHSPPLPSPPNTDSITVNEVKLV